MTERSRLGQRIDDEAGKLIALAQHYGTNVRAVKRLAKIGLGIAVAQTAAIVALAGRLLGAW